MTEEKYFKKEKKDKIGKACVQKITCVNEENRTDLDPELRADEKSRKKKRRKEKNVTECLLNSTNEEDISKTKKKKKNQVGDYEVEALECKIPHGKKKKKKKSKCSDIEYPEIEEEEEEEKELPKKAKKKRNKPGEQIKEKKSNTDKNTRQDTDKNLVPKMHKKSKITIAENQESEETGDDGVKKNKMALTPKDIKKTKKKEHGNTILLAESNDEGKKKKNKSTKSGDTNVEEEKRTKRKTRNASVESADVEETKPRKNRKSKQDKQDEEQQSEENVEPRTDGKKRKRKERATAAEAPRSENAIKRKKKKKAKEEESPQEASLSVKNGSADEATVIQEQRQAFQMETDQAPQAPKAATPSGLGQWSTAQFDSCEKQQKFLRLMGGFKRGFQPSAGTTARANMALGRDGQQQLQQKLLDEFDRAHSRRLDSSNRGAGIGFAAPANQKFFIDINASRSVRFDD